MPTTRRAGSARAPSELTSRHNRGLTTTPHSKLPPALAAAATPRILALLGDPPAHVLELGFAGIHATPLRLAGFEVTVVEPDPEYLDRARERAGDARSAVPHEDFDAVVAPEDADLSGIDVARVVLVGHDGSVWSSPPPGPTSSPAKSSPT